MMKKFSHKKEIIDSLNFIRKPKGWHIILVDLVFFIGFFLTALLASFLMQLVSVTLLGGFDPNDLTNVNVDQNAALHVILVVFVILAVFLLFNLFTFISTRLVIWKIFLDKKVDLNGFWKFTGSSVLAWMIFLIIIGLVTVIVLKLFNVMESQPVIYLSIAIVALIILFAWVFTNCVLYCNIKFKEIFKSLNTAFNAVCNNIKIISKIVITLGIFVLIITLISQLFSLINDLLYKFINLFITFSFFTISKYHMKKAFDKIIK